MIYGVNDLFVGPASGGAGRHVAHVKGDFFGMTWTADSASLVFSLNGDLWRVAAAGGEPEKLLAGQDAAMPTISPDGNRLAYTTRRVVQREPLAGHAGDADPVSGTACEVDLLEPDPDTSRVLARWSSAGLRVHPFGNAGSLDQRR